VKILSNMRKRVYIAFVMLVAGLVVGTASILVGNACYSALFEWRSPSASEEVRGAVLAMSFIMGAIMAGNTLSLLGIFYVIGSCLSGHHDEPPTPRFKVPRGY